MHILPSNKENISGLTIMEFVLQNNLALFSGIYGLQIVRKYMLDLCENDEFWDGLKEHLKAAQLLNQNNFTVKIH